MKKGILLSISMLLMVGIITGCGCKKKEETKKEEDNKTVVEDQVYEGLEFVNVEAKNKVIKTMLINNTGVTYEGSKFLIKIMDENGKVIKEVTDELKGPVKTGTTKEVETKVDVDLSKAVAIEYSIVK